MTMTLDGEREAFEKWHRENIPYGTLDPAGILFRTWKAACAWQTCNWGSQTHLTQPAQSVDAQKVREVIARVAADNQKSALTLGVEGLRGQCIETAKKLHKLAATLQEPDHG